MSENIPKRKLLVISDTAVFKQGGILLAFEPVVRELDALAPLFDEIVWLGCKNTKDRSIKKPESPKIKIIQMPAVSGSSPLINKINILIGYPVILFYILKYLKTATHIHTRAPSHPAFIAILISLIDRKRKYWHKYAGNWIEDNPAFTYGVQRKLLKAANYNNIKVTVNGQWDDQPPQICAFENPCVYEGERIAAEQSAKNKEFGNSLSLLFVGNLAAFKGIMQILNVIENGDLPKRITTVYIVGNGELYDTIKKAISKIHSVKIELLGHLKRSEIDNYYRKSHIVILPSSSEGFPKVIAEGAAYGCIPVVTDISSLSQYIIDGQNGFLIKDQTGASIKTALEKVCSINDLKQISFNAVQMGSKFTYEYFKERIKRIVFNID